MTSNFKLRKKSINGLINERKQLSKKFVKLHGSPVLIHATHDKKTFLKILEEHTLKIPKNHNSPKKLPYMEKLLNIDNGIYYSFGFAYATDFNFNYNFLFDLEYLKECTYFDGSLVYRCYHKILKFWDENDQNYVQKLRNYNNITKKVIDEYYTRKVNGKTKVVFSFYRIEDVLFKFINEYHRKNELLNLISDKKQELEISYPKSVKLAKEAYLADRSPEAVGFKDNNLLENRNFLGFYIKGKIPQDIQKALKTKFSGKILFDGKKIRILK